MLLDIRYYGDPVLRKKTELVNEVTDEIKTIVNDMIETLLQEQGLGLAAPQVGISKRILVVDAGEERGNPLVLLNPVLVSSTGEETMEEGCLSFPGIYGKIKRGYEGTVQGVNLSGEKVVIQAKGLEFRAYLHELDHLDGVLFIDRMSQSHRIVINGKLKKLKKRTLELLGCSD